MTEKFSCKKSTPTGESEKLLREKITDPTSYADFKKVFNDFVNNSRDISINELCLILVNLVKIYANSTNKLPGNDYRAYQCRGYFANFQEHVILQRRIDFNEDISIIQRKK